MRARHWPHPTRLGRGDEGGISAFDTHSHGQATSSFVSQIHDDEKHSVMRSNFLYSVVSVETNLR